jgi:hypothetical protein
MMKAALMQPIHRLFGRLFYRRMSGGNRRRSIGTPLFLFHWSEFNKPTKRYYHTL